VLLITAEVIDDEAM